MPPAQTRVSKHGHILAARKGGMGAGRELRTKSRTRTRPRVSDVRAVAPNKTGKNGKEKCALRVYGRIVSTTGAGVLKFIGTPVAGARLGDKRRYNGISVAQIKLNKEDTVKRANDIFTGLAWRAHASCMAKNQVVCADCGQLNETVPLET